MSGFFCPLKIATGRVISIYHASIISTSYYFLIMDDKIEHKQAAFWKDLTSVILTCIIILLSFNLGFVMKIASTQTDDGKELVRIKTNQETMEKDIISLKATDEIAKANIYSLKIDYINMIKDWTDENYIRKPQK